MGHVTPGGETPAREQPVHRDGGPTLGGGNPTSAGTSTQKVFFKYDVCHSKRYLSCVYDYQVYLFISLPEDNRGNEQLVHLARKCQMTKA